MTGLADSSATSPGAAVCLHVSATQEDIMDSTKGSRIHTHQQECCTAAHGLAGHKTAGHSMVAGSNSSHTARPPASASSWPHLTYGVWLLGQPQAQLPFGIFFSKNASASSLPSAKLVPPNTTAWPSITTALCCCLSAGAVPDGATLLQRHSPMPGVQMLTPDLSPPYSTSSPSTEDSVAP